MPGYSSRARPALEDNNVGAYLRQLPYASDNFGTVSVGLGLTLSRVLARIGKS